MSEKTGTLNHHEEEDADKILSLSKTPPKFIGSKKITKNKAGLFKFLKENINKSFCIISHDNPDCDSIASAYGMSVILQFLGSTDISLVYDKEISHPQNRALCNVLNIPLKKWNNGTSKRYTSNKDTIFIYVDCLPSNKNVSVNVAANIIIDHHSRAVTPSNGILIHDEVGACSTIISDLLLSVPPDVEGSNIEYCFSPDQEEIQSVCTALAIGIKTDTHDFSDTGELDSDIDFRAYKILTAHMSKEKFNRINDFELPKYLIEYEHISWKNRKEEGDTFISGLGEIPSTHSDCLGYLCDKYLRMPGVQTALIYAIVDNNIKASIRTVSTTVSAATLCDDIFGEENGGVKSSQGVGGAKVTLSPIFNWSGMEEEDKEKMWDIIKNSIESKFKNITSN